MQFVAWQNGTGHIVHCFSRMLMIAGWVVSRLRHGQCDTATVVPVARPVEEAVRFELRLDGSSHAGQFKRFLSPMRNPCMRHEFVVLLRIRVV